MGGGLDKERKSKREKMELRRWEVYGLTRRFSACHSLGFCSFFILRDSLFFFQCFFLLHHLSPAAVSSNPYYILCVCVHNDITR